ncbi:CgeB family protein [Ornithinibacillus halophilus]|uniref:DUF3880 domain-containing protein n=1 Tax=Ornithinibacillus halophilus TaxID=930117 RepID=A0A1M5E8V7_9BACI|nr:hypothetical protein [Ornithinibacillus halophilus]SHF75669.1 hypothetical protein SAMN05216225_100421 [Ornithinibacillus halophilus]
MDNFFLDRRKAIENEKEKYEKQLLELNTEMNLCHLNTNYFETIITSMKQTKNIMVKKKEKGIYLQSNLPDDDDHYFHFTDDELLGELIKVVNNMRDKLIALSFPGRASSCKIELRLTFIDTNENKKNVRLLLGEKRVFRLDTIQQIKQIKMRIYISGEGAAYIQNPMLMVKKTERTLSIKPKQYSELAILSIRKDKVLKKFESEVRLYQVDKDIFLERFANNKPDIFLCSSHWLTNTGKRDKGILYNILYWCVERNIPTVLWDTATSSQYPSIIEDAKLFDIVLTANEESIDRFTENGCKNVSFLPYSVKLDFPNTIESYYLKDVAFVDDKELNSLPNLKDDLSVCYQERIESLRNILEFHTIRHKVESILDIANINYCKTVNSATMIAVIKSKQDYQTVMEHYLRQTMPNKKLVMLIDFFDGYLDIFNENNKSDIKTYLLDYIHHYESINDIIETSHYAPINSKCYYDKNYLRDMYYTSILIRDSIIVKNIGKEFTFVTDGNFDKALIPKSFSKSIAPRQFIQLFNEDSLGKWFPFGIRFFNTFNFEDIT